MKDNEKKEKENTKKKAYSKKKAKAKNRARNNAKNNVRNDVKPEVKDDVKVSEHNVNDVDREVKTKVSTTAKTKKEDKGNKENILLCVFGVIIIVLIMLLVHLNKNYFSKNTYYFDYLSFEAISYGDSNGYKISKKNNKCHILLFSKTKEEEVSLNNLGEKETINDHEWVKQEFENGVTWMTNYNKMFYIIQMYAEDEDTYSDYCEADFETIKDTFSFNKNE